MKYSVEMIVENRRMFSYEQVIADIREVESRKVSGRKTAEKGTGTCSDADLTVGEALCIELMHDYETQKKTYFNTLLRAAAVFKPLFDKRINDVDKAAVEHIIDSCPKAYLKGHCRRLLLHTAEAVGCDCCRKKLSNSEYVNNLSFPSGYKCPKNIRLKTLMEYWIYENRDKYSPRYINASWMTTFHLFKPLHQVPFNKIRPSDIMKVISGKSIYTKEVACTVYRSLDWFAYFLKVNDRCYARDFYIGRLPNIHRRCKRMPDDRILTLEAHAGEKETDVVLTFLYTGIKTYELLLLTPDNVKDDCLDIRNDFSLYSSRRLPLMNNQLSVVRSCIETVNDICGRFSDQICQKSTVRDIITDATNRHLGESYLPSDLRFTFEQRLLSKGVPIAAVEYLRGTNGCLLKPYEEGYRHYSEDVLRRYMEKGAQHA